MKFEVDNIQVGQCRGSLSIMACGVEIVVSETEDGSVAMIEVDCASTLVEVLASPHNVRIAVMEPTIAEEPIDGAA